MGKSPVLDLDALVPERPTIRIRTADHPDGKLWELRVRSELSIMEIQRIMRLSERAEALQGNEITVESMTTLSTSIDDLLGMAIAGDYSGELKDVLTLEHKVAIVEAFTSSCLATTPPRQAKAKKVSTSTGAK